MGKWQQIIDYIHFIGRSNNSHGIHSPFVFNLYNEVLNVKKEYYENEISTRENKIKSIEANIGNVEDSGYIWSSNNYGSTINIINGVNLNNKLNYSSITCTNDGITLYGTILLTALLALLTLTP